MTYKTLDDLDFAGKRALVRVDVNVPMQNGAISDDTRIQAMAPTIQDILRKGGKPILLAHFGRPKGKKQPDMSLAPLRLAIEQAIGAPTLFSSLEDAPNAAAAMAAGQALLVENVRFHPGEETNAPDFAQALAALGDVYVNDAFSAAHRAHASTAGVAKHLPAAAGRLMARELATLEMALSSPERPVAAVVGGAKVSTKLDLLGNLVSKVDELIIGGGMANTFLAAEGKNVGKSLCEHDMAGAVKEVLAKAADAGCRVRLPKDVVVAYQFAANAPSMIYGAAACPPDAMILDAGPQTVAEITDIFARSRTLVWNGPLGAFELPPFNRATNAAAQAAAKLAAEGMLLAIAGGGDTVAALNAAGAADRFSYVSTAGGAFLEWLEGKKLPGVAALETT
ncbi:MAG: phosphoglycerate kinase [Neomegalonema sp.]|nr:phosphoglycerate kinase [Neomegalonema sp.]